MEEPRSRTVGPDNGTGIAERGPVLRGPVLRPTPIPISRAVRNLIVVAVVATFMLIIWAVPVVLVVALGGFAIAMVLSSPVHLFSRVIPRGLAILLAFLILIFTLLLVFYVLAPLLLTQMVALVSALPGLIRNLEQYLIEALETLDSSDLLPGTPEATANRLIEDLTRSISIISSNIFGNAVDIVFGTFSFALTLFAVAFVAASLLANARNFKAVYLASIPTSHRRDALELWNALAYTLSRYLGGLAFVLAVQGVLSAVALYLIGVPYALALGAWVSITALIPLLGAWLGAIPALLVAFSISPTAVLLTAVAFLAIQQIEGNFLTPRILGQAIRVPSVIIFLGVITGGALAGIMGVLFAVPTLAVLRVLFDFFRVRLRTE